MMPFRTLTAEIIASWEREVGPTPIHGVALELLRGGTVERHYHARGQIMLVSSGVITVFVHGNAWVISGSRAVWVPEGVPHHVRASTGAQLRNLQVSRAIAPDLPDRTSMIAVSPLFRELVLNAVSGPNEYAIGSREQKIIDLLLMEFRPTEQAALVLPEPTDRRLQRICSALRADPSDNRTLREWSEIAGGCARTLERLFLKETGLTFAQWRRQLRLLDALVRLNRGESVTCIALDTGYENPSAFIEMFRRIMGRTPGQYLDS
jgi:AraC-like DNA-binding protein